MRTHHHTGRARLKHGLVQDHQDEVWGSRFGEECEEFQQGILAKDHVCVLSKSPVWAVIAECEHLSVSEELLPTVANETWHSSYLQCMRDQVIYPGTPKRWWQNKELNQRFSELPKHPPCLSAQPHNCILLSPPCSTIPPQMYHTSIFLSAPHTCALPKSAHLLPTALWTSRPMPFHMVPSILHLMRFAQEI